MMMYFESRLNSLMTSTCARMLRMKYYKIMALKVLHGIANDIAKSGHYSIMADETTDASNIEKLVICISWVDKEMTVCKE